GAHLSAAPRLPVGVADPILRRIRYARLLRYESPSSPRLGNGFFADLELSIMVDQRGVGCISRIPGDPNGVLSGGPALCGAFGYRRCFRTRRARGPSAPRRWAQLQSDELQLWLASLRASVFDGGRDLSDL